MPYRHCQSIETKNKLACITTALWQVEDYRLKQEQKKHNKGGWNRGLTKETDARVKTHSIALTGRHPTDASIMKRVETQRKHRLEKVRNKRRLGGLRAWELRRRLGTNKVQGHPAWNKGLKGWLIHSEATRQKMSEKVKAWLNTPRGKNHPAYARTCKLYPNKPEFHLLSLLDTHFPNEFKYVGNGKVIIEGRCPDFININGKKQVIELLGTYWHSLFDGASRIEHYRQYGFQCLVVWEDELNNEGKLIKRIKREVKKFGD